MHMCVCVRVCCRRTYRMGVADSGDVLTGSSVLHGQSSFVDHLSCPLQGNTQTTAFNTLVFSFEEHILSSATSYQYYMEFAAYSQHTVAPLTSTAGYIRITTQWVVCGLSDVWDESSYSSDDVSSQHPVRLLVAEDLHHAVGVSVGLGSAVGCEGELADSVGDALRRRGAESDCKALLATWKPHRD